MKLPSYDTLSWNPIGLRQLFLASLLAVVFTPCSSLGAAVTYTWTNGAGDDTWSTSGDWSPSGPPTSADTAIFDTLGDTSTITIGATDTANVLDFGASSSSSSTLGFTLGTAVGAGTLNFSTTVTSVSGSNALGSLVYQGTGNTATETINSNVVYSAASGSFYLGNFTTSGVLTINGDISHSGTPTNSNIYVKGTGNINLTGAVGGATDGSSGTFNDLNDYMTSGTLVLSGSVAAMTGGQIILGGATASSETGGNLLIETGSLSGNTLNLATSNATGAFQFKGGLDLFDDNVTVSNMRAAGDAGGPVSLENISGNNSLGDITISTTVTATGYLNIESDAGTLSVGNITDTSTVGPQSVLLYGAGNGNVMGTVSDKSSTDNVTVVKDGTGTWTLSNGAGNTYSGGTTVKQGTLQVSNATGSATGTGNVALGAATLTGTGAISGMVTASGASGSSVITPGAVDAVGALSISGVNSTSGLTFDFAIDALGGANSLLELGDGGLAVTGGALTFNLYDLGSDSLAADTPYDIITSTGSVSASSINANLIGSDYVLNASYGTDGILIDGDVVSFEVEAVPEPAAWNLMAGGLVALMLLGWARRRGMIVLGKGGAA